MDMPEEQGNAKSAWFTPSATAVFALLSYTWLVLGVHEVVPGKPVALVFPHNWTERDILLGGATLDVDIIGFGNTGFVLIVNPRAGSSLDNLGRSGALFAMNAGSWLACSSPSETLSQVIE